MEFKESLEKNFFVIDSNNLDNIDTRLYGYAIHLNQIFFGEDLNNISVDGTGAYVYVSVIDDEINIYQDINGCFGIYIFNKDGYFAISNSFIKLVNYLKDNYELTLNYEYSISFLSSDVCSYDIDETLVNEINILPREYYININKNQNKLFYKKINYAENSIPLNSFEGITILDEWYNKWRNVLHNIFIESNNISFDLSGGFDSRGIMPILFSSDIDLTQVNINSIVSDVENYSIAKKIAEDFDVKLNNQLNVEYGYLKDMESYFMPSVYTKWGSIKLLYANSKIPKTTIYKFTGYGGECIRGYPPYGTLKGHKNFISHNAKKYSNEYGIVMEKNVDKNFDKLDKIYAPTNHDNLVPIAYKETRARYLYGKTIVEKFCTNHIYLSPYFDPLLYKLKFENENCNDKNLIIATIYDRYCPQLLNYPISGNRKIDESTIKFAKLINKKYPFSKNKISNDRGKFFKKSIFAEDIFLYEKDNISFSSIQEFLHSIFATQSFKNTFKKYFSENIYKKALLDLEEENSNFVSIRNVFSVLAVVNVIMDIEYSNNAANPFNLLKKFSDFKTYVDYGSDLQIGNLKFIIPDEFWINDVNSITNGKIYLYFKVYDETTNNLKNVVNEYIDYIKKENGFFEFDMVNINNVCVYKVKNINSHTIRYWFEQNNII